jgi:hypothetical protein
VYPVPAPLTFAPRCALRRLKRKKAARKARAKPIIRVPIAMPATAPELRLLLLLLEASLMVPTDASVGAVVACDTEGLEVGIWACVVFVTSVVATCVPGVGSKSGLLGATAVCDSAAAVQEYPDPSVVIEDCAPSVGVPQDIHWPRKSSVRIHSSLHALWGKTGFTLSSGMSASELEWVTIFKNTELAYRKTATLKGRRHERREGLRETVRREATS